MSYQRQSCNGTTIETIDGKHYINGVEVETGKIKKSYYVLTMVFGFATFVVGFIVGINF